MQDICTDTGLLKEVGAPGELSVGASEEQFLSRETPPTPSLGCTPAGQVMEGGVVSLASARNSYTPSLASRT